MWCTKLGFSNIEIEVEMKTKKYTKFNTIWIDKRLSFSSLGCFYKQFEKNSFKSSFKLLIKSENKSTYLALK